jgi:DNA-binding transcriptional LysR family regulator
MIMTNRVWMNLRRLECFVAVAEELHFGRAADRLGMAQPPLSQQISRLEQEIGVELLRRSTRRVELTEAGAVLLERARRILAEVDDAGAEARLVAAGALGRVSVGCVGSVTYSLLPALARGLSDDLPGIEFSFRGEMLVPDQVEALRSRAIDVALLRPPVVGSDLEVTVLRRERLVVAVPADHRFARRSRLTMSDLRGEQFIVHSGRRESAMSTALLALSRSAGFSPRIRHEVGETSTLVTLVAGGLGVAVVPEPVSALQIDGVRYIRLADPDAFTELAVARLEARDDPALLRSVAAVERIVAA